MRKILFAAAIMISAISLLSVPFRPAEAVPDVDRDLFRPAGGRFEKLPSQAAVRVLRGENSAYDLSLLSEGGPEKFGVTIFGRQSVAQRSRIERRAADNWSWFGKVAGTDYDVIFTYCDGKLHGTIYNEDGQFSVLPSARPGVCRVMEMVSQRRPPLHLKAPQADAWTRKSVRQMDDSLVGIDGDMASPTINLLVYYTSRALQDCTDQFHTTISALLQAQVDYTNQCYANSQIGQRISVVSLQSTDYQETADANNDLNRMAQFPDGYWDNLLETKHTLGADITVLIAYDWETSGAYRMDNVSINRARYALSVLDVGDMYSSEYMMAHELGHVMCLMHDWCIDGETVNCSTSCCNDTAPYTYAHGYWFLYPDPPGMIDGTNGFRTIMSYPYGCGLSGKSCAVIPYYSNPAVTYNGYVTGVSEGASSTPADEARALGNTAATVASFRNYLNTCTYSLTYSYGNATASAGYKYVSVNAGEGCKWRVATPTAWISIDYSQATLPYYTQNNGMYGSTSVKFDYTANTTGSNRTGYVTITPLDGSASTLTFTFEQAGSGGSCTVSASPATASVAAAGGSGSFTVSTTCNWTAYTGSAWLHPTPASGSGNGTVNYTFDENTGSSDRTGTITVTAGSAQATHTVTQQGLASQCTVTMSPWFANFNSTASGGSFTVSIPSACSNPSYTATSSNSWLHVTGGAAGSSNGTVNYTVDENTGGNGRSGSIIVQTGVGNQVIFSVSQQAPGVTCNFTVGSFSTSWASAGGTVSIPVTASVASCAWNTSSTATWVAFAPQSAVGTGSTTMTVAENTASSSRSCVVNIAGTEYTVTQAAYTPATGVTITSISSKKGTPGSACTIKGTGFSKTAKDNVVKFGTYITKVKKSADKSVTTTIPKQCKKGTTYQVVVTVKGKASNAYPYTVKK